MWSRKFEKCIKCGSTENKHLARGLCAKCYHVDIESRQKDPLRDRGIASKKLTKQYLIYSYFKLKKSLADIAKECSCSRQYVHKKMLRFKLPLRGLRSARTLAIERKKLIFDRVDDEGHHHSVVLQKVELNNKFFSNWTPEMAYVLGVVYTDGCLSFRKHLTKSTTKRLPSLSIAQKEPELLEKVLALMNCNAKLHFREKKVYGDVVAGPIYWFNIDCTPIYEDLVRLGLNPNKSLNVEFPEIPSEYVRHFIRGCWDGDGSVFCEKGKNYLIANFYSGSLEFIKSLLNELEKADLPKRKIHIKQGKTPCYYFKYTGSQCIKLYHYFYDNVSPIQYLERKYNLFKKFSERQQIRLF